MRDVILVGYGRIARASHLPAIQAMPGLRVRIVVDPDPTALAAAAAALGGEVMVMDHLPRQVTGLQHPLWVIATPSGMHPTLAQEILTIDPTATILVEKPIGVRLEAVDALQEALRAHPRATCVVVKQNRFNPAVQWARAALAAGAFGRLTMLRAAVLWNRDDAYYAQAPWRGTYAQDGGAFLNQAVHYVDLLRWLGGPVARVQAETLRLRRAIEAEDSGAALFRFTNGTLGVLEVTVLTPGGNHEGSLTLVGDTGLLVIGGTALNRITTARFTAPLPPALAAELETLQQAPDPASVYGKGHVAVYRELADPSRCPALPTVAEARESLEMVLAAYAASDTGRAVHLPTVVDPTAPFGLALSR